MTKISDIDKISRYENGEMNDDEITSFFQEIIESGLVWELQGSYIRMAEELIEAGLCRIKVS
jgi:hypothetical protein